ncbi:uncharacterized protein LOC117575212 [Drosophila albomicans]|uniref:Uncharacterized protein LOC117575212 n=1 Tax=Drosophila albomicans TaxID=7291 RepID=A0A6P8ZDT8_DROAB|nr:uncharacterized protein LOC117575212 [Drosophila albomicans]
MELLRFSTVFAVIVMLHFSSPMQAAPVSDVESALASLMDSELVKTMQWNSRKLLEIQELLSEKRILYLEIIREQKFQRTLVIGAFVIDFLLLVCMSLHYLLVPAKVNNKIDI